MQWQEPYTSPPSAVAAWKSPPAPVSLRVMLPRSRAKPARSYTKNECSAPPSQNLSPTSTPVCWYWGLVLLATHGAKPETGRAGLDVVTTAKRRAGSAPSFIVAMKPPK